MLRTVSTPAAAAVALAIAFAPTARAQITLSATGGASLGSTTNMTVGATPGTQFLLILSLNGGPTPLPPPHQPAFLDVGFDLLPYFVAPPFLGVAPATIPLSFPLAPVLDSLTIHFQAVRIVNNARIDGKSNPWILTPALPGTVEPTLTAMSLRRASHQVIAEPSGTALIIGGGADGIVASFGQTGIDRYDPGTQKFTHVGDMVHARSGHTATRLQDGRILIAGGADDAQGEPDLTAEIFDPVALTSTAVGNMAVKRALHSASLLPDGRVLIIGGTNSYMSSATIITGAQKSSEIFNPATNTFTAGPVPWAGLIGHTATVLQNGKVLIAGGYKSDLTISNEGRIYTPVAGQPGSFGPKITMQSDRFGHAAVRLPNGNVVLGGGAYLFFVFPLVTDTIEMFDVTTSTFSNIGVLSVGRATLSAAALPDGTVVFAGGATGSITTPTGDATVDQFDPPSGALLASTQCIHPRGFCVATTLADGTVLITGGGEDTTNPNFPLSWDDAELFHP